MPLLRELTISRLNEIRQHEQGFQPTTMKWNITFANHTGCNNISTLDFNSLTDDELAKLFETIVKHYYEQMYL